MQEGSKFVGATPVRIEKSVRQPKKTRHATPKYPDLPPGTVGSGIWMGEVLTDTRGKVAEVWTIRDADLRPPFPAFSQAIVDAIRGWEFEPLIVDGQAVPACATVTMMINWS
jgi:hypothetical protein